MKAPLILLTTTLVCLTLAACGANDGRPDREALHARIIEALRSDEVTYLRYTFQESPEKPVEQHELWIDWSNERSRLERKFPDLPVNVTLVTDGMIYEGDSMPRPTADAFAQEAITGTHLLQWLLLPDAQFREPPREVDAETGVERYVWTSAFESDDSGFCGEITLDLDADDGRPIRSYAEPCSEVGGEGRGFATEYERIDEVPRANLPPDFFEAQERRDTTSDDGA